MNNPQITYTGYGRTHTLPIGRMFGVKREGASEDICLERAVDHDCPLVVSILIRTTGEVVLWDTNWQSGGTNTYWHFGAGSNERAATHRPTAGQLATLERMFLGLIELPGKLRTALGRPVASWAFVGHTASDIAAKHGVPAPALA